MTCRAALLFILGALLPASAGESQPWEAGAYSFSDELGGFRITNISGQGTRDDPIIVEQEFLSSSPVTMVIRAIKPIRPFGGSEDANGTLRLRLNTLNNSGQGWVEFEFELQEIRELPSTYGDGLSFDQRRKDGTNALSDSFARFDRSFEPADRLRFTDGLINPLKAGSFEFTITDFTPKFTFYLVEDPRIPSS